MNDVSEAEIEAMMRKLRNGGEWVNWASHGQHCAPLDHADRHAAADLIERLTAAAQVRHEQAVRDKIAQQDKAMMPIYGASEEMPPLPGQVKVADSSYKSGWKWAFPATEPDQGEDKLGMKGEG